MKYGVVEIHGRFLEPDPKLLHNREEEEEEDVDDFQDFDFKQLNSLAAGAHNIETKVIKRKTGAYGRLMNNLVIASCSWHRDLYC